MLFRVTLLGFLWVAMALAVQALFGGGAGVILAIGVLLGLVASIVVCFLKGRWAAGGTGVLVFLLGFPLGSVQGPESIALLAVLPFLLAGLLVPVFRAGAAARPGSLWARRFPRDKKSTPPPTSNR